MYGKPSLREGKLEAPTLIVYRLPFRILAPSVDDMLLSFPHSQRNMKLPCQLVPIIQLNLSGRSGYEKLVVYPRLLGTSLLAHTILGMSTFRQSGSNNTRPSLPSRRRPVSRHRRHRHRHRLIRICWTCRIITLSLPPVPTGHLRRRTGPVQG